MERYRTVTSVINEFRVMRPGIVEVTDKQLLIWLDQMEGRVYTKALMLPHEDLNAIDGTRKYQYEGALTAGSYHFSVPEVEDGEEGDVSYGFTLTSAVSSEGVILWEGGSTATVTDGDSTSTVSVTKTSVGTEISVTDEADRLIVPEPWAAMYVQWLMAQADYMVGENERYTNDIAVCENTWREFIVYVGDRWHPANKKCGNMRRLV